MGKEEDLKKIIKQINSEYSKSGTEDSEPLIYFAGDFPEKFIPTFVPCNVPEINEALGGGFPRKAITVIHGPEGSGKTALSLSVAAEVQRNGEYVLFLNTEGIFEAQAKLVGLNKDLLITIDPKDYAEQMVDAVEELLFDKDKRTARDLIGVLIVDSINGLVPEAVIKKLEAEGSAGETMARSAKLLTDFLTRLTGRGLLRKGCICICIAQNRANLSGYGGPTKMSGALALRYMSKVILNLGKKPLKDKTVGHTVQFNIEKNNVIGKLGDGEYKVIYGHGVSDGEAVVEEAQELGIIVKGNTRTSFVVKLEGEADYTIEGGIAALRTTFTNDLVLKNRVKDLIRKVKSNSEMEKE